MTPEQIKLQNEIEAILDEGNTSKEAKKIIKLILIEQLELLRNFYYTEGLEDHEIVEWQKDVLKIKTEDLEQQLKELE